MNDDDSGEYTRYRMQIQRGDGPDRRGKVEVEIQREHPEARANLDAQQVELPNGETTEALVGSAAFSEFLFEVDRATHLLEQQLGLEDEA